MTPSKKSKTMKCQTRKNMKTIETIARPEKRNSKMESSRELKSPKQKRDNKLEVSKELSSSKKKSSRTK